ncbi:MAG: DUF1573 domain-containing protein [Candidatus Nealsonbacteria bacterium]|nr:DUF1573 domain-containing protein [Candidatus Nealsonbacteria bacterium]
MNRQRFKMIVLVCGAAALLWVGWINCRSSAALSGQRRAAVSAPQLVATSVRRDLGTVARSAVLRTTFRVANRGTRRLVLVEQGQRCCGGSVGVQEIIVPPGDSRDVPVQVDVGPWLGRMEQTVQYTTNDPQRPRFSVTVFAKVIR